MKRLSVCVLAGAALSCQPDQPGRSPTGPPGVVEVRVDPRPTASHEPAVQALDASAGVDVDVGLRSCEQAKEDYLVGRASSDAGPEVSAGAYGAVLNNGRYMNACAPPYSMTIKICTAVIDGRVVGVTVDTEPADRAMASCVAKAITTLAFPSAPSLDVTRTTFRGE